MIGLTRALTIASLFWSGLGAEADTPSFTFVPTNSDGARVEVDVSRRAGRPVSRLLYGKFTEHLGRNIYLGMWAQLLVNPGFEPAEFWGRRAERVGRELAWRSEMPELIDAFQRGLPPGWLAEQGPSVACQPDQKVVRTGRQSLRVRTLQSGEAVRVWQPVFLPLHRQSAYEWSLWVRSEKAGPLTVRLRSQTDTRLRAEQTVSVTAGPWKKYSGRLKLPAQEVPPAEPLVWEIEWTGLATAWLDQSFLFPADHEDGWDPDIVRMIRESHLPLLRWPGGNFSSGYHWKDGIGPIDDRPMRLNRPWNMPEPNHVGTDEFLRFCELVGAEPMICVNAGDGTADEAADWVEYCNGPPTSPMGKLRAANGHPEPYGVGYWEIGNELYGQWQIGHCSAQQYAERYRRFVGAMRRRDPSLRLIANGNNLRWNGVLVERCAEILERVSLHTLIGGGISPQADPEKVWWLVVGYPWAYRHQLRALSDQLRRRVPNGTIAITELQIFTNRPKLPNNGGIAEALFWAGVVHTAVRKGDRVELITHSALVNHGGGLRKQRQVVFANPVYWARRMYSTHPGRWPVAVRCEGPTFSAERLHNLPALHSAPVVDVMALLDDSGKTLVLLAINREAHKAVPVEFRFRAFSPAPTARWQFLTGPDILAANTLDEPNRVRVNVKRLTVDGQRLSARLPARSVSVITLSAEP